MIEQLSGKEITPLNICPVPKSQLQEPKIFGVFLLSEILARTIPTVSSYLYPVEIVLSQELFKLSLLLSSLCKQ